MALNIEPPGPKTNHRHPRCFAAADNNCSAKSSSEHYISEVLLRQIALNGTAKIAGLRWQAPETFNIVGVESLASNILCDRHNSALGPLDATVGELSDAIRTFDQDLRDTATGPLSGQKSISGDDIERWMLKCLIGLVSSGNLGGRLKPECIDLLYGRMKWPDGWGLYWLRQSSPHTYHSDSFLIETSVHPETQIIMLTRFVIRGLPFGVCLGKPDMPQAFGVLRPAALHFRSQRRERRILLDWQRANAGAPIMLDRAGTYDGPPPDWKAWERET